MNTSLLKKCSGSTKLITNSEGTHPKGFLPYYMANKRKLLLDFNNPRAKNLKIRNIKCTSTIKKEKGNLSATINEALDTNSQKQLDYLTTLLQEQESKLNKITKENKELVKMNERLRSVLSIEQMQALNNLELKRDFSNNLRTHGDVHVLYQNWYVKDLKNELVDLKALSSEQKIQIRILEEKLDNANKKINNLKDKLKRCFVFFNTVSVPEATPRTKEQHIEEGTSSTFNIELKKLQDIISFINKLSESNGLSSVCKEIIEYFINLKIEDCTSSFLKKNLIYLLLINY